jgi:hypothetical protein
MLNLFKNIFFLPLIVVAALGLAPSYAAKTVTYYTFVTYNINGEWELAKPVKPAKLAVGSYRFQIVRFSHTDDTPQALVIALRGEFQFVADPRGGVQINKKYALDEPQQVDSQSNANNDNNDNFSVWRDDVEKSWEKARKQWVQPLITEMSKSVPGDPEPNFIRFLLGKESIQEWKGGDKNTYRLYRLHYNTKAYRFFDNKNDRKTFSLFINPTHEVVTDIVQLQEWVDSEESFTLAKYMGKADDKHKAFYGNFKTWFNQLSSDAKRIKEVTGEIKALQEMVRQKTQEAKEQANKAQQAVITAKNAGISTEEIDRKRETAKVAKKAEKEAKKQAKRFKKSVAAVKKALKVNNLKKANDEMEKANEAAKNAENAAKNAENAAKEAITTQKNSFWAIFLVLLILLAIVITAWFLAKKLRNRHYYNHEDDHEDDFVDEFFDNNKENKLASKKSKPELSKNKPSATISNEELHQLNKRLLALENKKNVSPNVDHIGNKVPSQDELSSIVAKILNEKFSEIASQLFQHSEVKNAMKSQIKTYLDGNFKKELNKSIELYAERYWKEFIEKKGGKNPVHSSTTHSKILKVTSQAQGKSRSQLPNVATNNVIDKIKAILLSMKSVNESALNTLDTNVDPCTFITNVVANCLKLNQPETHYQRLTNAIADLTGGKAALIISSVGDDIRPEEHNVVGQQTVAKGKLNVVASLIRPGVKCDNIIERKAEVIQNV